MSEEMLDHLARLAKAFAPTTADYADAFTSQYRESYPDWKPCDCFER
jgi:hypothetical protein